MESAAFKFGVIQSTLQETDNVLTVTELCDIAGVSRSGYYGWLKSGQYRQECEEIRAEMPRPKGKPLSQDAESDTHEQHSG